jgi:futalosine hydrolase
MNLLIVAATKFEIEPFLQQNKNIEILITGVGIPATIFHLTKKLIEKKFDCVVQAGVAGTFVDSIDPGEVFFVKEDTFADVGIDENGIFKDLFDYRFLDKNDFPFSGGWLINNGSFLESKTVRQARSVTVNKITDDKNQLEKIIQKYSPQLESMEGAAFHYVCLQQKINFLQLRSVSNKAGERDKTKWQLGKAIETLNRELIKITKEELQ